MPDQQPNNLMGLCAHHLADANFLGPPFRHEGRKPEQTNEGQAQGHRRESREGNSYAATSLENFFKDSIQKFNLNRVIWVNPLPNLFNLSQGLGEILSLDPNGQLTIASGLYLKHEGLDATVKSPKIPIRHNADDMISFLPFTIRIIVENLIKILVEGILNRGKTDFFQGHFIDQDIDNLSAFFINIIGKFTGKVPACQQGKVIGFQEAIIDIIQIEGKFTRLISRIF